MNFYNLGNDAIRDYLLKLRRDPGGVDVECFARNSVVWIDLLGHKKMTVAIVGDEGATVAQVIDEWLATDAEHRALFFLPAREFVGHWEGSDDTQ